MVTKIEIVCTIQFKKNWTAYVKKEEKRTGRVRQNSELGRQALEVKMKAN